MPQRRQRTLVARLGCLPDDAPSSEPVRDVVVIGGGIAGLSAAWDLRNRDVVVLESTNRLGGRIRSEPRAPYWLNLGAHVFSGPGSATGRLVADVGVESMPVPGHLVALELNGSCSWAAGPSCTHCASRSGPPSESRSRAPGRACASRSRATSGWRSRGPASRRRDAPAVARTR